MLQFTLLFVTDERYCGGLHQGEGNRDDEDKEYAGGGLLLLLQLLCEGPWAVHDCEFEFRVACGKLDDRFVHVLRVESCTVRLRRVDQGANLELLRRIVHLVQKVGTVGLRSGNVHQVRVVLKLIDLTLKILPSIATLIAVFFDKARVLNVLSLERLSTIW